MKTTDLKLIRERLQTRREAILAERHRSLRRIEESTCDVAADPVDRAAGHGDFDVAVSQAGLESEELKAVTEALAKIDAGSYGSCEDCEEEIPGPRLLALPSARLCIDCQTVLEREDAGMLRT